MDHHNCGPEYCVESCLIWLHPKGRIYALPVPNLQAWGAPLLAQLLWELFLCKYESKVVSRKPASGIMEDDVLCLFCTRVGLQNRLSPIADDLKVGGGGQLAFFNVLAVNEW